MANTHYHKGENPYILYSSAFRSEKSFRQDNIISITLFFDKIKPFRKFPINLIKLKPFPNSIGKGQLLRNSVVNQPFYRYKRLNKAILLLLRLHCGEQQNISYRSAVGKEHNKSVETHTETACGR